MTLPNKHSLRSDMMAVRERIDAETSKTASIALARHLLEAAPREGIVAGYYPVRGEIGLHEALAGFSERGHELCLPVIKEKNQPLIFRHWRIEHPLELGHFNIRVPPENEPEMVPDIVIVPVAAFDAKGHRLGYGAGYYDLTIAALRQQKPVTIIGAAYAAQQVAEIPTEGHDEKLDLVVTERGIIRLSDGSIIR